MNNTKNLRVLMVSTSHSTAGDNTAHTGIWMEELAGPYYAFKRFTDNVQLASPKGGAIPIDPTSEQPDVVTTNTERFRGDEAAMSWLATSAQLSELQGKNFDLLFIVGGHGSMWDLEHCAPLTAILGEFIAGSKPIGAVGSGIVALISVLQPDGSPFVKGKKLTAYSNGEIALQGLTYSMPFLLETKLLSLGAFYSRADGYGSHVVTDGNLVTGQNPASSVDAAEALKELEMSMPVIF